jgi:sugar transferase (PEP-CTERM/EpsH1 system associated)
VRILWVKAGGLLPLDSGGRIRSYNLVRELAKRHRVTFFGFHAQQDNAAHAELNHICERVLCFPLELPEPKSLVEFRQYATGILSGEPHSVRKFYRPHVASELRALLRKETYDILVSDFVFAASVIPWDIPCPKILFTHNVEATIWKRHYDVASNPLWKLLSWREWRTMERTENGYLKKADLVVAVSNADRDVFSRVIPREKLAVIPTGVDVDFFQPRPAAEEENTLVFTGSMDWLPNEDGMFYFVEEIFPRISRQVPTVKLIVVGRKPSRRLKALAAGDPRIELTGWVEDVRPYLASGSVCIVPLRVGSGTRLKIFEAMSMGKAVVSTTIGAEGLPVKSGSDVLLADAPEDFATCVVRLLRDKAQRQRLGAAARHLVENKFSWFSVAAEFEAAMERCIRASHQAPEALREILSR